MVNEVNKIIRNALLTGGNGVFLPGIGSLTVKSRSAVRTSGNTIEPPRKTVQFHEEELGISVIDEISRAGVDMERAHEIYNEWRVRTYADGVRTIEGIGVLENDRFSPDKELLRLLNPQGTTPVKVKPKLDIFLYIFAILCCAFAFGVAGYIWYDNQDNKSSVMMFSAANEHTEVSTDTPAETVTEDAEQTIDSTEEPKTEAVKPPQPAVAESAPAAVEKPAETKTTPAVVEKSTETKKPAAAPAKSSSRTVLYSTTGNSYLVLGIFSTEENAYKAVANAERTYPYADCRVYHYSDKFMVALFESSTSQECVKYKRSVAQYFPDAWIYTKR